MNKFRTAAVEILKKEGRPLHAKEITRLALERGILETEGATPEASMISQLLTDIKTKGELSDFKKVGPSTFALNEKKAEMEKEIADSSVLEELETETEAEIEGGYIGHAGEYAVLSELMFRGYNAALMSVDTGVDILATKDNDVFKIQVKTRNISKYNSFDFNIRIVSFERHNTGSTFYIFLLRENSKLDYLILPLHELEKSIEQDFVNVVGRGKLYRVRITKRDDKIYLGRKENEMTYYLNRWETIK